ncbi:MAG: CDP-alcohol phosphatidyltransferase family protein [Lachnospiraceae bacterium]|nr:CDP-alcohol phosphatidyltransferase family protein [Lachnospiraceae bacterium]
MIGFYNYTVVLTYIGLASAVVGMTQVFGRNYRVALLCLIVCGTCDMFDGKIARAKKDRTKQEKVFGIQIDSLCDLICFGMFPATLGYSLTAGRGGLMALGTVAAVLYVLGAVIRLGYFNVMEQERQEVTEEHRKYYQGLPVTSVALILPCVYILSVYFKFLPLAQTYNIAMIVISFLFIFDFKVKKPGNIGVIAMTVAGLAVLAGVLIFCE